MRLINEDDLESVAGLNLDPEVRKYFPDGIQNKEQTRQRISEFMTFYESRGLPCFVIHDRISKEFIGRGGFGLISTGEIEVGYLIAKKFWNMGYASEVLQEMLDWSCKNIESEYIIAFSPVEHHASRRVMEKCGMEFFKNEIMYGVECGFYRIKN